MKGLLDWIKFLFTKTFWKNIFYMLIFSAILLVSFYFYLMKYTRHGSRMEVPDLYGKRIKDAEKILKNRHLQLVITDTLNYDPDLPKYAIREQNPKAGASVKKNRKIYVKVNAGSYRAVSLPKLRGLTLRQAKSTLQAMGIKVGKIEEKPYFAEVVLEVIQGKDTLRKGDKLPINSVVQLIVGSGEEEFERDTISPTDTLHVK